MKRSNAKFSKIALLVNRFLYAIYDVWTFFLWVIDWLVDWSFGRPLYSIPFYGAQNEAYMSRSTEKLVRGLCFNELGVSG